MQRIADDPNRAVCPSFEAPEWEFLRQSVVNAHQGDQPLTLADAAQQMKDAWALENQHKIAAWGKQVLQDQAAQEELDRVAREEEDVQRALLEKDEAELRKETEKKKPKLEPFDRERRIGKWIQPRPSSYALNKLNNLEYVELDYFTPKGCRDAATDSSKSVSHDTLAFTQVGDTFAIRPMAAIRPSKHIWNDKDISWEDMIDGKNIMLHFMAKSGLWPDDHAASIAMFFFDLEHHQRKDQKNGKLALLLYQSRVRREWFDALKRGEGFNIELIEEDLLRSCAEEVNDNIRERDNAIRDREFEQVRFSIMMLRQTGPNLRLLPLPAFVRVPPFFPLLPFPPCCHHISPCRLFCAIRRAPSLPFAVVSWPYPTSFFHAAVCRLRHLRRHLPSRHSPTANCRPPFDNNCHWPYRPCPAPATSCDRS